MSEARYSEAILNSAVLLERVKPLQTLGLFGERDFDKYVFLVPFPAFDEMNNDHILIADLAKQAEELAAGVDLSGAKSFPRARKLIDLALVTSGLAASLESAIDKVIPAADPDSLDELD